MAAAKRRAHPKACGCIDKVNAMLARHRVVSAAINLGTGHAFALVETEKHREAKRSKPVSLIATYCPFCGRKYPRRREGSIQVRS